MYCDKISHSCIAIVYMHKLAPGFKMILWDVSGIPKNGVGFALVADCELESAVCSRMSFVQMRSPTLLCVLLSGNRGDQLWYAPPHPTYHRYNNNNIIFSYHINFINIAFLKLLYVKIAILYLFMTIDSTVVYLNSQFPSSVYQLLDIIH